MLRRIRLVGSFIAIALGACDGPVASPAGVEPATVPKATSPASPDAPFVEDARWQKLAVPIAFTHDGRRWVGGDERELVVFEGDREVDRIHVGVALDDPLFALPDGGWVAGASVLAADGSMRFSGHAFGQRFGMFGSAKAMAVSTDGSVAIVAGADSPSACGPDCPPGSSRGALARITLGSGKPVERLLVEHEDRRDFDVAASSSWVAALEHTTLSVWPASGDDPATIVEIDDFDRMFALGERWLVAQRFVDPEHTEVLVLDRDAGWRRASAWTVDGKIHAIAVRPGTNELAIATTRWRARTTVEVDEKRVYLYTLEGERRGHVDTHQMAQALAWSPKGDVLLVGTTGRAAEEHAVLRFVAR